MIGMLAKRVLRRALESRGYYVKLRRELPYGINFLLDIERLSRAWCVPVRTFFDVGANEGQTSQSALLSFKDTKVFAFEPHPLTFSELQKRLAGNARFVAHNVALGESTQTVSLFEYRSSLENSLVPDAQYAVRFGQVAQKIEVQCITLDEFSETNNIRTIDVLKIDTEGYDLFVLRGARKMLSAGNVCFVYAEFNSVLPKVGTTGGALIPLSEFLVPFGFQFIASYTDYVVTEGEMFTVANALFALPPLSP